MAEAHPILEKAEVRARWGKRILVAIGVEVLAIPLALVAIGALYAVGLPGLEIVMFSAAALLLGSIIWAALTLPRRLRTIWNRQHG